MEDAPPPSMASDDTGIDEEAEEEANLLADTDDRLDKAEPDEGLLLSSTVLF